MRTKAQREAASEALRAATVTIKALYADRRLGFYLNYTDWGGDFEGFPFSGDHLTKASRSRSASGGTR